MRLPVGLTETHAPALVRAVVARGLTSSAPYDWPTEPLADPEWDIFASTVDQQRIWSMVATAIVTGALPVTDQQTEQVFREDDASVVRCLQLDRALLDVHRVLSENGVDVRFFKGATTALRFYAEPGERPYADIDLLVRREDLEHLTDLLLRQGATRDGDRPLSAFRTPAGCEIDIHDALRHGPFGAAIPAHDLFDSRQVALVGDTAIPTVADPIAFIAACFNAILPNDVRRIVPLRDVATMMESALVDESEVIELARRWRCLSVVAAAACAATELFVLDPTSSFVPWGSSYAPNARERRWLDSYLDPTPRSGLKQLWYTTEALGSTSERTRFLRGQFLHPGRDPAPVRARRLWHRLAAARPQPAPDATTNTNASAAGPRVFHVVDSLAVGGAERMAVDIANELDRREASVDLVATRVLGPLQDDVRAGVRVHCLDRSTRWDIDGVRRFRSLVRERQPLVVHAHGWSSLQFCTLGLTGLRPAPALVFHDHRPAGLAPLNVSYRWSAWPLTRAHIAVDRALLDPPLRTRRPSIRQVVPNGIPLDRFTPKHEYGLADPPRLVVLANLRPQKDHPGLIEAIAKLATSGVRVCVDLIGSTPDPVYTERCQSLIDNLDLRESVVIVGPSQDTGAALSTYDVGILSSHTESGPIALIEYLAAGLPFVVTDAGEIPALLPDSLRRWVVPPENPAELARTVRAVLAQSPEERAASAAEALAFATNNLSIERTVDSIEAVYRLVTRRRGA